MLTIGKSRQAKIYLDGFLGKNPSISQIYSELEKEAKRKLSKDAFGYLSCGAGTNQGCLNNIRAFECIKIRPRMLQCQEDPDVSAAIFNTRIPLPFLFAPIGVLGLAHPQGDLELAKASLDSQVPMIQSCQASYSMEACAAILNHQDRWFQLYYCKSKELVESFIYRAEVSGCSALVVTLDTTSLGWRSIDLNNGYLPFLSGMGIAQYTSDPVFKELMRKTKLNKSKTSLTIRTIKNLITLFKSYPAPLLENLKTKNPIRAVQTFVDIFSKPDLSWEDISWLKSKTKLPVILKGILHPDDAKKAIEIGVDGIIISNHGGRQVDRVVSSLDSLKEIKDILPADYPVLLDSGIRTGLDVFIALAFGANAVCIGRPYAYALAVNGKEGVLEYIMNIASELKITMSLCGCKNIKDINREMLIV